VSFVGLYIFCIGPAAMDGALHASLPGPQGKPGPPVRASSVSPHVHAV